MCLEVSHGFTICLVFFYMVVGQNPVPPMTPKSLLKWANHSQKIPVGFDPLPYLLLLMIGCFLLFDFITIQSLLLLDSSSSLAVQSEVFHLEEFSWSPSQAGDQ